MKKTLSLFLSIVMLLSITASLNLTANAEILFTDVVKSGNFDYQVRADGTAQIYKYNGQEADVVIPDNFDGIKVTAIGDVAFDGNKAIVSVSVPDSVTLIDNSAFRDCTSLTNIKLSNSLEKLVSYTFENCTNLKEIVLPESLTDLGGYNFVGCKSLEKIEIPKNVVSIGSDIFFGCYKLQNIYVADDNSEFADVNGILYNKEITKLISIPSGKKITTYKAPLTVKAFDQSAFNCCKYLKNIVITQNVKNIHKSAFENAYNLKKISVAKKNKYFSAKEGVLFNKKKTVLFHYPSAKTSKTYVIPKTVTTISAGAFDSCKYLAALKMPKKVKLIEQYNYSGIRLASANPFYNCKKLRKVYYGGSSSDWRKIYFYEDHFDGSHKTKITYFEYGQAVTGKSKNSSKNDLLRINYLKNAKVCYNAKF